MNFDSFLSSPRWEILKLIADNPSSTTELSVKLGTTAAYVSQQLKLLDAAGLISKTKTGASEKGKPRSVFQLSGEKIYVAALTKGVSDKITLPADDYHNSVMKIWLIEDSSLHYYFEKLYWVAEGEKDTEEIYLDVSSPKMIIVSSSKTLKSKIESFVSRFDKPIDCSFVTRLNSRDSENIFLIYSKTKSQENKK